MIDERFDGPTQEVIGCPKLETCCKINTIIPLPSEEISKSFTAPKTCGFRNAKGLGGLAVSLQNKTLYAQYAEFPWMMAILVERTIGDKKVPVLQSGGSLIHPKVVLTTAHNIAGLNSGNIIVRAGEWDMQSEKELEQHEERKVDKVIRHPQFTRSNLRNDLALLVLIDEFELNSFINTICLPPKNTNFDHQRCFSSGWGKTSFARYVPYQAFLKKVELPIIPSELCQEQSRATRLGEDFILHDKMICAGKYQLMFRTFFQLFK